MVIEALYLFDVNEQFIDLIPGEELLEHGQTQELKKLITANASALYSEGLERAVFIGHRDVDDSNVFHQYRVTTFKNTDGIVEIEGVHAFFDDMQAYGYIKDKRPTEATAGTALGGILEGSRWQIGINQCTTSATSNYYYVSRLEAFWDFVEKWNVEFKLRMVYSDGVIIGRYIDIYDQLSADYGKWYEYGDQLLTVEKEEDRQGVYTALIGRGKGEETEAGGFGRRILFSDIEWTIAGGDPVDKPLLQEYVELPSATAQYGYSDGTPRIGIVEFEDITDPALLLESTYYTLLNNCRPQVQFRAGVDEKGVSEIGEIVSIIRDDLHIRYKTRVYKLRRNFLDRMDKEFTFGDKLVSTQGERSVQINKEIKKQQQQTISWLEVVNAAMMSMFWNEDGYNYTFSAVNDYGLPGGFYSFNAPIDENPTKCIYMGAGMLAIANSKLPDGSWNFRSFGTGDGFTADLINAGVIVGTNMTHDLEAGESTYTHPTTGAIVKFNQGEILYEYGSSIYRLLYGGNGLGIIADPNNTGNGLNAGIDLVGLKSYIDFRGDNDLIGDYDARIIYNESDLPGALQIRNNNGSIYFRIGTTNHLYVQPNLVGILTGNQTTTFQSDGYLRSSHINANTISGGATVVIRDDGVLFREASALKYKTDVKLIENELEYAKRILELHPKHWVDKGELERDESNKRYFGIIAEDVREVGLDEYTNKNTEGELEGLQYDRLWTLLIPIVREQETEIASLKQELADLKTLLTTKGVI